MKSTRLFVTLTSVIIVFSMTLIVFHSWLPDTPHEVSLPLIPDIGPNGKKPAEHAAKEEKKAIKTYSPAHLNPDIGPNGKRPAEHASAHTPSPPTPAPPTLMMLDPMSATVGSLEVMHYDNDVWKVWFPALNGRDSKRRHYVPREVTVYHNMRHTPLYRHEKGSDGLSGDAKGRVSVLDVTELTTTYSVNGTTVCKFELQPEPSPFRPGGGGFRATIHFPNPTSLYGMALRGQADGIVIPPDFRIRMYNRDIFRHTLDPGLGLYGTIPLLYARDHTTGHTFGIFWLNAADTSIEVDKSQRQVQITSDAGGLEWFLIPGPTPLEVQRRYMQLTGFMFQPPLFALGYHQCRWSYMSQEDVLEVNDKFLHFTIPMDSIWLDIDHTDDKKYFTWNHGTFPSPEGLQQTLWERGARRLVTISDPHIKVSDQYYVYREGYSLGMFVKKHEGKDDFHGHCWPGDSVWIDFTSERARTWYASQYGFSKYKHSTPTLYTWIDMNEPSVFSGPELTMPKDNVHAGGHPHASVHNVYGFFHAMATFEGHLQRSNHTNRPFILTRSFFAGTQRYAAVWTGDNQAKWEYLRASIAMVLTLSICGIPLVGSDIGGFFDDPSPELLLRWYQAGVSFPFFRGHSHNESPRREPYLSDLQYRMAIQKAIHLRYRLIPYFYTTAYFASEHGGAILRPLWFEYPDDPSVASAWKTYLIGSSILVHPITDDMSGGTPTVDVTFPKKSEFWCDIHAETHKAYSGTETMKSELETFPMFLRGGSIVPLFSSVKTSTRLSPLLGYTLLICPNEHGTANGNLYVDDGVTNSNRVNGSYLIQHYKYKDNKLTATPYVAPTKGSASARFSARYDDGTPLHRMYVDQLWVFSRDHTEGTDPKFEKRSLKGGGIFIKGFALSVGDSWELKA